MSKSCKDGAGDCRKKSEYHPSEIEPVKNFEIDIEHPKYDQNTYAGRCMHFFVTTNPFNVLKSSKELERCACIVRKYRNREPLPYCITVDELWKAKQIYDSAFHPDTGEKMILIGRMSAQVPMNIFITGGLMIFYKGTFNTVFWQWFNQSFNALVNYTNRSGASEISNKQLLASYVCATTCSVGTALSLNHAAKKAPPVIGRLVPFCAIAAANMINIPFMRAQELREGIVVEDEKGVPLGRSKLCAQKAISAVVVSRISMAAPGMALSPFVMNYYERQGSFIRYPWMPMPLQIGLIAVCLTFATPMCCAFFKQKSEIEVSKLEPELRNQINQMTNPPKFVFYNKGL